MRAGARTQEGARLARSAVLLAALLGGCGRQVMAPAEKPQVLARTRFGDNCWLSYGTDIGGIKVSLWDRREDLLRAFEDRTKKGYACTRFWLFADVRAGIIKTEAGLSLGKAVDKDLDTLFSAAREAGFKLAPVLLDFTIADGQGGEPGEPEPAEPIVAEHADWLTEPENRQRLVDLLVPVVRQGQKDYPDVEFWDLMNEPCHAAALTEHPDDAEGLFEFIQDVALAILQEVPDARISVGFRDRKTLLAWAPRLRAIKEVYERRGGKAFCERFVAQFHHYPSKHDADPENTLRGFRVADLIDELGLGEVRVVLGELDPALPSADRPYLTPNGLRDAGFDLVLYWSDTSGLWPPPPSVKTLSAERARPKPAGSGTARAHQEEAYRGNLLVPDEADRTRLVAASSAERAHFRWNAPVDRVDVRGRLVEVEMELAGDMSSHKPGWYANLTLRDTAGRTWYGAGERIPEFGQRVRLWATPFARSPEIHDDARSGVDLSRIARIGMELHPGIPRWGEGWDRELKARLALGHPAVEPRTLVLPGRHGVDVVLGKPDGVRPAAVVDLLAQEGASWQAETYFDSQGVKKKPRLTEGRLEADYKLVVPHRQKEKGEIRLDLGSVRVATGEEGGDAMKTGALLDLRGCLARFRAVCTAKAVVEPAPTYFFTLAVEDPGFRRLEPGGEVKALANSPAWIQFWIPPASTEGMRNDVCRRASALRLKAALDEKRGAQGGSLVVDRAEIVPVSDEPVFGVNLLARRFASLQAETWPKDRAIASPVRILDGTASFSADLEPDSRNRSSGRIIWDVRQNSFLPALDLRGATIHVSFDWGGLGSPEYFIEVGLEDTRYRFAAIERLVSMEPTMQSIDIDLSHSGFKVPVSKNAPDLADVARLIIKIGAKSGCETQLSGKFRIVDLRIEKRSSTKASEKIAAFSAVDVEDDHHGMDLPSVGGGRFEEDDVQVGANTYGLVDSDGGGVSVWGKGRIGGYDTGPGERNTKGLFYAAGGGGDDEDWEYGWGTFVGGVSRRQEVAHWTWDLDLGVGFLWYFGEKGLYESQQSDGVLHATAYGKCDSRRDQGRQWLPEFAIDFKSTVTFARDHRPTWDGVPQSPDPYDYSRAEIAVDAAIYDCRTARGTGVTPRLKLGFGREFGKEEGDFLQGGPSLEIWSRKGPVASVSFLNYKRQLGAQGDEWHWLGIAVDVGLLLR